MLGNKIIVVNTVAYLRYKTSKDFFSLPCPQPVQHLMLLRAYKLPRHGDEIWAYGVCHKLQKSQDFTLADLAVSGSKAFGWAFTVMK